MTITLKKEFTNMVQAEEFVKTFGGKLNIITEWDGLYKKIITKYVVSWKES